MQRFKKKFSGLLLLVIAALCAGLIFAVSFRFPGSAWHAAATLAGLAIAGLLVMLSQQTET